MIKRILRESGSSVEIAVVRPKNTDVNLCKSISHHYSNCNGALFNCSITSNIILPLFRKLQYQGLRMKKKRMTPTAMLMTQQLAVTKTGQ